MKLLFISAALVVAGFAHAQHRSNVHFGIKGGLNITNLASSPDADYETKAGFHAGGLAHIHLSKSWALQPEIMYSGQGAQTNDAKVKLDYVNVPLQLQYMFDKGFRIQTGPQLGILAAANVKQGDSKTDVKESFKTAELGWTIGASYVGESGLGIDGRYNHGITRINANDGVNLYNRGFQVGLFYVFKHKY
ncbi:porin family protein [Lacibacter sp.]|uniref:porin family protein n=1 Tax=Lacibacter sp. TaxID=1915409 RepID=UPI002B4B37E6|nr:porin family protein [Lacibacter sp.]HLP39023.1 porin family protein [Lacibacter sp.]